MLFTLLLNLFSLPFPLTMTSKTEIIDDADSQIVYAGGWSTELDSRWDEYNLQNNTIHATADMNATATIRFSGKTFVTVQCLLWYQGANFYATLDGTRFGPYNTHVSTERDTELKGVWTEGLDPEDNSEHTLMIGKANDDPSWRPSGQDWFLHIDSIVFGLPDGTTSYRSMSRTTTPGAEGTQDGNANGSSESTSRAFPVGGIIGLSLGIAAIGVILVMWLLMRRRKFKRQNRQDLSIPQKARIPTSRIDPFNINAHTPPLLPLEHGVSTASSDPSKSRLDQIDADLIVPSEARNGPQNTDTAPDLQSEVRNLRAQVQWLTENAAGVVSSGDSTNEARLSANESPPNYEPRRA